MIFQKYNSGNKRWVKIDRSAGCILANEKEKFAGIPLFSEICGKSVEPAVNKTQNSIIQDDPAGSKGNTSGNNEEIETDPIENESQSGGGFFDFN